MTTYNIINADPPWSYENKKTGGSMKSGAGQQYATLSLEDLMGLPVPEICDKDAVLFLWAVTPLLPEAFAVMKAWGFEYKSKITWEKTGRLGMGFWFRVQTEELLFGVKGKVPAFGCQERNIVRAPIGEHSEKPECFRKLIEDATALTIKEQRRLEVFARRRVMGWDAVGYGVDGLDIRESLERIKEGKPTTTYIKEETVLDKILERTK